MTVLIKILPLFEWWVISRVLIVRFEYFPLSVDIPTKGRHDSALKVAVYSGTKVANWIG
jgi:hypothetical protein